MLFKCTVSLYHQLMSGIDHGLGVSYLRILGFCHVLAQWLVTHLNCLCHKQENTTHWKSYPFNFHMPRWVTLPDFSFLLGDTVGMAFKQTNQPNSSMQNTKISKHHLFGRQKKSDLQHAMAPCPAPTVVKVFLAAVMVQVPQAVVAWRAWRAQLIWRSPQPEGSHQHKWTKMEFLLPGTRWKNHGNWSQLDDFDDP